MQIQKLVFLFANSNKNLPNVFSKLKLHVFCSRLKGITRCDRHNSLSFFSSSPFPCDDKNNVKFSRAINRVVVVVDGVSFLFVFAKIRDSNENIEKREKQISGLKTKAWKILFSSWSKLLRSSLQESSNKVDWKVQKNCSQSKWNVTLVMFFYGPTRARIGIDVKESTRLITPPVS